MCSTRAQIDAADLWAYSKAVYAREGVAAALIALQDRHRADVNMVLFTCWVAARRGRRLTGPDYAALEAAVGDWRRSVIEPLRQVRRGLGGRAGGHGLAPLGRVPGAAALRAALLDLELDAERAEQALLVAAAVDYGAPSTPVARPDVGALARASLAAYLPRLTASTADLEGLAPLFDALRMDA